MKNPLPSNEKERLEILRGYNILDSLPEKQFDDITKLASIICEVPITLISIIDEQRQWFKSKIGISDSETLRKDSFCQYAIMDNSIFEVENSIEDERFVNNPYVTGDPNIRFYAGAPLTTSDGFNLGTLCVIDTKPRKLSENQKLALNILANEVVANIELRKEKSRIESEKRMMADSNNLLHTFFENSPSIITMKDVNGCYVYVNKNGLSALGKPASEVLGKNLSEILPPHIAEKIHADDQEIIRTKKPVIREYSNNFNGETTFYISYMFPLINNTQEVYGVGVISNNITASKKLETELTMSNNRFTSLFYNSPICVIIADMQTSRFIMVNNNFLQTFGYEKSELIGKSVDEINLIVSEEDRVKLRESLTTQGRIRDVEFKMYKKSGEIFYSLSSVDVINVDGRMQIVSAFQDITERKKMEDRLHEAKQLAEDATASKSNFLANMSHEIRTPLNAMLGFSDLLSKTSLSYEQKEYLEAIETSGKNLMGIINDILDFSKIEAGMLSLETVPFSIQQTVHSVYAMFFSKAQKKGLRLFSSVDPNVPSLVAGDPTKFNQILINLIGNAIKFTSEGTVMIECTVKKLQADKLILQVSIKDTGIGIPHEKLGKIFDRFTQAEDSTTRNFGGTGLGLSIAKKLVEMQGGELMVTSEPGKGSEFLFTIHYTVAYSNEYVHNENQVTHPALNFQGTKTLIVEDNPLNQKLASTLLRNEGFEVEVAENGEMAVQFLKERQYDVILMDIQMPIMDGYEATSEIRTKLNIKTPIIAMTANAIAGEKERCIELGMDDYITKPFKAEFLLDMIARIISKDTDKDKRKEKVTSLTYLMEFSGGNKEFIKEMIETFIEQNHKDISTWRNALNDKDFVNISSIAHKLQTSLGFVGFSSKNMERLKLIESMSKERTNFEMLAGKVNQMITLCEQAREELKNTDL